MNVTISTPNEHGVRRITWVVGGRHYAAYTRGILKAWLIRRSVLASEFISLRY